MNNTIDTVAGELLPAQTFVPRCFVCGQENPSGLKLRFTRESDTIVSTEFTAPEDWTGWGRMLHGGFHGLLLDETMAWVAWGLLDVKTFVTREMTVKYLQPVHVQQPLKILGYLEDDRGRDIFTRGEIRDERGNLLTESRGIITRVNTEKMKMMR